MRDSYTPTDQRFLRWKAGHSIERPANPAWVGLVRDHVARGVSFRRARIVSEPVTDYIRFEHEITNGVNIAAGEKVRWLPRRAASDLCLPGNDFWVFDEKIIRFHHFSGDGEIVEDELVKDPDTVRMCVSAFEAVWERALDHEKYQPF
ncbi:hypothetical protein Q8791_29260 [Nocardiopsis sp. CT-R113]|uniref:DUF6879 domain-containing protein n=1 Tax=Nocardiopsis codii TaxID=3065942 RepID=A0ABU7KGF4_9ACTN|nr:DUF6879 family protein [Nocardiopsis sp. CT-R113]MEE2041321.1 hypothetical protein [Nocardiopsis sp. CT-R113]